MKINLTENKIDILYVEGELKPSNKGQLQFFGLRQSNDSRTTYTYAGEDCAEIAKRVYKYFIGQQMVVEASPELLSALELEQNRKKQFERLMKEASFKSGNTEGGFSSFCRFAGTLQRQLKPHQLKASYHHLILRNSADFSVPGSGKTTTLLTAYEAMRRQGLVNCLFIVGPPSSFTAWKDEYRYTFGRRPVVKILAGTVKNERINSYYDFSNRTEMFLTSFQTLSNDSLHIAKFFSHPSRKVFFVVDEAHYIKQIDGKWASAVLEVGKEAVSRHVLTGTPCPQGYADLFNMFDLLWGKNVAISEEVKAEIAACEKDQNYVQAGALLKERIDPLFYRVRKSDLGLRPPIFHEPIKIRMNEIERAIYDAVFRRLSESSRYDSTRDILTLLSLKRGRIVRLRQLTSYAKLLQTAVENYSEDVVDDGDLSTAIVNYDKMETPAKITALLDLVRNIRGADRKVLIWSNFIGSIEVIARYLTSVGLGCARIYGDTPIIGLPEKDIKSREQLIEEFLSFKSDTDVLIANPGACAESISLHKSCHHAIYYDLSYNCAQYLQSLDRIHRVGGSEDTDAHYYFLQYEGTIDKDIHANLLRKRDKMYRIIEYDSDIYGLDVSPFVDGDGDAEAYDRIFRP